MRWINSTTIEIRPGRGIKETHVDIDYMQVYRTYKRRPEYHALLAITTVSHNRVGHIVDIRKTSL